VGATAVDDRPEPVQVAAANGSQLHALAAHLKERLASVVGGSRGIPGTSGEPVGVLRDKDAGRVVDRLLSHSGRLPGGGIGAACSQKCQ
jgi:hypothetical protein